jgi:hypothetical protein
MSRARVYLAAFGGEDEGEYKPPIRVIMGDLLSVLQRRIVLFDQVRGPLLHDVPQSSRIALCVLNLLLPPKKFDVGGDGVSMSSFGTTTLFFFLGT